MNPSFVHLHLHTEYSLIDGLVRIQPLIRSVVRMGMPAVAVTDQANLFCLVRFYKAALSAGIKPIAGSELWVREPETPEDPSRLVVLIQNRTGYRNLARLLSRGYFEGRKWGIPQIERAWLEDWGEGLIALSGGIGGDVGRALLAEDRERAKRALDVWLRLFGDRFYLELSRTGRSGEETCLQGSLDLAESEGVPVVATNDVRFLEAEAFEAHEIRVCIHNGDILDDPKRPRLYRPEQYLRTPEEMAALFSEIPEALENSVEIAKRCTLELTLGKTFLPNFPVPDHLTTEEFLTEEARRGLRKRFVRILDPEDSDGARRREQYEERLQMELDVINQMGFAGYFLIVADFIRWAKTQGIPVGPGRGSGAGSLVAYALGITDLDPIEYDLLFERFLNPERVSMPDFDVDFCMDRRDRVIEYVSQRYGHQAVSQIITFGTLAAKAVVRDVGRVLGYPYGFVDRIAKMVPFELGMTLEKALRESEDLRRSDAEDEEVHRLIELARQLEGLARNAGKHAGGVVIAPKKLTDFTPLYWESGSNNPLTQYDKDDVEQVGLVKFDFLGLRTLTIIDWAVTVINAEAKKRGEKPIEIAEIDRQDEQAFALLKRGDTTAVFQLESSGIKELIRKLQPDCFEDIIALVALYRPGPLQSGMVDDFIARKHGRAKVTYPHPALEPILKPTYGVILYQEQVMQIAQVLAGYTLGSADLLRRAMGKKKPQEMAKQRGIFLKGATERGVDPETATAIFDLMEKFAGYGFNRSHSAAYALVSYQTLWLKAHHPAAFMAAVLSADMDNTEKVVTLREECHAMGLQILPPAINRSEYRFTAFDDRTLFYGLGAIKGVGESAIEALLAARREGHFRDLWDLCRRVDLQRVNRRVLEILIRSGVLDDLGPNRATLAKQLPQAIQLAEQERAHRAAGLVDLFGSEDMSDRPDRQLDIPIQAEWDDEERLRGEKETLGFYQSGHPIDRFAKELDALVSARIGDLLRSQDVREPRIAGLVTRLRHRKGSRGRLASLTLDDGSGCLDVTVFSEVYETVRKLLAPDRILVVQGILSFDTFRSNWSLRASEVQTLEQAREARADHLLIQFDAREPARWNPIESRIQQLRDTLEPYRGGALAVQIQYLQPKAQGRLCLGPEWGVRPEESLLDALRGILGSKAVTIAYQPFRSPPSFLPPEKG